jgi:hypothetical protein
MKRTTSPINASKTFLPTHRLVLRSHVEHQPEEIGAKIRRLLEELVDLREQQRKASNKENEVFSRLHVALGYIEHSTQRSLFEGNKLSRWEDSTGAYSPDDDTLRPGKEHVEVHRLRRRQPNEGIDVACGQCTRIKGRH